MSSPYPLNFTTCSKISFSWAEGEICVLFACSSRHSPWDTIPFTASLKPHFFLLQCSVSPSSVILYRDRRRLIDMHGHEAERRAYAICMPHRWRCYPIIVPILLCENDWTIQCGANFSLFDNGRELISSHIRLIYHICKCMAGYVPFN